MLVRVCHTEFLGRRLIRKERNEAMWNSLSTMVNVRCSSFVFCWDQLANWLMVMTMKQYHIIIIILTNSSVHSPNQGEQTIISINCTNRFKFPYSISFKRMKFFQVYRWWCRLWFPYLFRLYKIKLNWKYCENSMNEWNKNKKKTRLRCCRDTNFFFGDEIGWSNLNWNGYQFFVVVVVGFQLKL